MTVKQAESKARVPRGTASELSSQINLMLKEMDNESKQSGRSDLDMLRAQLELERVALEREKEHTKQREYELRLQELEVSKHRRYLMVPTSAQLGARPERKDGGHPAWCNAPPQQMRMRHQSHQSRNAGLDDTMCGEVPLPQHNERPFRQHAFRSTGGVYLCA